MAAETSAVVTGAGRGIGREVAALLVTRGHHVVVTDIDGETARRTAAEIGAAAGVAQDVRDEASHAEVAEVAAAQGRLAVWVNNAGVGHDGLLTDLSSAEVEALLGVNLLGVVWGMRAALAAFGTEGGDILNIASLSGLGPVPGLSLYAATKAGVVSLTASVSVEVPDGVRVHAVLPDGVATDLVAAFEPDGLARALVHSGGRLLTPEETALAAVGLVGSRRVLRSVPAWRAVLMRGASLAPSVSRSLLPVMTALGRRAMNRV